MSSNSSAQSTSRRLLAEFIGTFLIVVTVAGAGHMVTRLGADETVGLLTIGLAVGMVLYAAITIFLPISGSHFNPAVTIVLGLRRLIDPVLGFWYIVVQVLGAISGAMIANLMFERAAIAPAVVERISESTFLGEVVATSGLVLIILLLVQQQKTHLVAASVGGWIAAGHIFTSSTSFANPAVTVGRSFTDAISGIHIGSVPGFVAAQLTGALLALAIYFLLTTTKEKND